MAPNPLARPADLLLEASIAGSYTSIGFAVRHRLDRWDDVGTRDLQGRTFLVTGASRGIGHETASMLLAAGAAVRSASRSAEHAERATGQLLARHPDADVAFAVSDLTDPADLDTYTAQLGRDFTRLDGVAHCAGAFYDQLTRTAEGVEANVALAVLTPHRLNRALLGLLDAAPDPRVVVTSSSGAYLRRLSVAALDPDEEASYRPLAAYALAKRAQIVHTHAWVKRHPAVAFDAMAPGWCDTELLRRGLPRFRRGLGPLLRSPAQGADTVAWLLARPDARSVTNRLWHDRRPRLDHRFPWTLGGSGPDELWEWCQTR